jgi:hypothetical protein
MSFKREGAKEASFLEVKLFYKRAYFKVGKLERSLIYRKSHGLQSAATPKLLTLKFPVE